MNTHKPDPSKLISLDGIEPLPVPSASEGKLNRVDEMYIIVKAVEPPPIACVCNPETNTTCMLHFNLDGFILAEALKEKEDNE